MADAITLDLPTTKMIGKIESGVGWMIFNNPERRNAVSLEMWDGMSRILQRFEADDDVRVIVLAGAGDKAFVSGADISQFEKQRSSPDAIAEYDAVAGEAQRRLQAIGKPTMAMIRGYCIGGGLGIAIGCDLRIAADDSKFGVPATRLGLGYGAAGVKKLMDLVGPAYAKEIFYTAHHFNAEEAWRMGLINRVVPTADLAATVQSYCDTIAVNAPLTMRAVKIAVEEMSKPAPDVDHARCDAAVRACFASEDYIEGRRAFMEKRKPQFKGK
jgi:enoyl-CoA hydratase/carnithine racemase